MTQQPSGWYDDPNDPTHLRYFDGVVWTEHRAPKTLPPAPVDPYAGGARPAGDPYGRPDPYASGPTQQGASSYGAHGQQGHQTQQAPWQQPHQTQQAPWQQPHQTQQAPWQQGGPVSGGYAGGGQALLHGRPLAGWWSRVGALLVDMLTVGVVLGLLLSSLTRPYFEEALRWSSGVVDGTIPQDSTPPAPDSRFALASLLGAVGWILYDTVCTTLWGRTLGKRLLRLRVVDVSAPERLGWGRALVRALVKNLNQLVGGIRPFGALVSLVSLLDVLFPLWDRPLRQSLHDKAARSAVVRDR